MIRYFMLGLCGLHSHLAFANNPNVISHSELARVVFGLLAVLFIILLLSWVLKKLNAAHLASTPGFKSIATLNLGTREKIELLQVGEQYLLIGITSVNINLLHNFGNQLPNGFDAGDKSSFANVLKSALRKS